MKGFRSNFSIMDIVTTALFGLISLLFFSLLYLTRVRYNYWRKRNVPQLKPVPILGDYGEYITLRKDLGTVVRDICLKLPDEPCIGAYYGTEPTLIVKDPEMIKLVTTKDFYYFHAREVTDYCHKEVLTQNIFFNSGDCCKVIRQNLTPFFSTARMRSMFYLVEKCAYKFESLLDDSVSKSKEIEVRPLCARYAMGSIGSCVFGIDTRTMEEPVGDNPFVEMGNAIFNGSFTRGIKNVMRAVWPAVLYGMGFKVFPTKIDVFFNGLVKEVFKSRDNKPSSRNDFVDLVLGLRENKYLTGDSWNSLKDSGDKRINIEVNEEIMIAQCVTMFGAGFETTATTICFMLYELSKNQEVQKRAQAEVDSFLARHNNQVTYDCMTELPYLNACFYETLRMYPVLGVITREVTDTYKFPNGVWMKKGDRVHIPVYHLHHNPKYFPDPYTFNPERFLPENKHNIELYAFYPFGQGPRSCIGKRFGKMQSLACLVAFLKKYTVTLPHDMPLKLGFVPSSIVTQSAQSVRLNFHLREGWEDRMFKP